MVNKKQPRRAIGGKGSARQKADQQKPPSDIQKKKRSGGFIKTKRFCALSRRKGKKRSEEGNKPEVEVEGSQLANYNDKSIVLRGT